jgi:DNA polymerase III delta prime subunit
MSEGKGETAHALLKILEEPPNNTTLILVTDKKSALFRTIISRCQPINFPALSLDQTRLILENNGIDNAQAIQIAMVVKGDIHLAREIADQSRGEIINEAEALVNLMICVDEKGWREFINSLSMLAFRNPSQYKFKIYLLQLWFHYAFNSIDRTTSHANSISMMKP